MKGDYNFHPHLLYPKTCTSSSDFHFLIQKFKKNGSEVKTQTWKKEHFGLFKAKATVSRW